jgi:hypothetical protein
MSTSRRQPASSRKPQPSLQPRKADTDDTILRIGIITLGASLEARENEGKPPNNPSTLTGSRRAHGSQPGQSGHQARNRNAQKPPRSVTPRSAVPNPRWPPVPPDAQAPQAPRRTLAPKSLPAPQPLPKPVMRQSVSIPKLTLTPKPRPLPKSSLPAPKPLPIPRPLPVTQVQVTSPAKGNVTAGREPEIGSKAEMKVKVKKKEELTPEQQVLKALRCEQRRERREHKKDDHYRLVLSATDATISILKRHGLSCAVFGSLACKLYGPFRDPKVCILRFISSMPSLSGLLIGR